MNTSAMAALQDDSQLSEWWHPRPGKPPGRLCCYPPVSPARSKIFPVFVSVPPQRPAAGLGSLGNLILGCDQQDLAPLRMICRPKSRLIPVNALSFTERGGASNQQCGIQLAHMVPGRSGFIGVRK